MPEYIMPGKESLKFQELSAFTRGYIEALLWTEEEGLAEESDNLESGCTAFYRDENAALQTKWIPGDIGFDLISPESLSAIIQDCAGFELLNKALLDKAGSPEQNGHDFWLTRNHHGAGFWDRGYGDIGEQLTEAAQKYGEVYVYLGNDGLIYIG